MQTIDRQIRSSRIVEHMHDIPICKSDTRVTAQILWDFGAVQALRGYALILTHPGVPCVFHWDYARRLRKVLKGSLTCLRMDNLRV